jgi:hypothetical protein
MATYLRKVVDKIYVILLSDAAGELSASFRYRLLIVVLALVMSSIAAFTLIFFNN